FQPDDIFINADREKITQVVSNLIANSIKFTQEGTITVMTRRNETTNQAIVTITDSGQGIHQEVLPKLFTKFVTKSNNGTGIGLYISKKIIEAHGGKLSGQNNPEGRGATFSFSLPMQHEGHDEIETPLGSPSANSDA
ncbi:MAG TPA: HAMP domain-containing sensor histidine kinase, partial [Nitrososphaera sp.]|nr:HAMP domain-containing sensor histidine kinase [Nitrososphaera sp.]